MFLRLRIFFSLLLLLLLTTGSAQKIVQAEYFFDADHGVGTGVTLTVPAGDSVNLTTNISVASLTDGFHYLYIRCKNEAGAWGLPERRGFFIDRTSTLTTGKPVAGEYFFDTDLGQGKGQAINVGSPTDSITVVIEVPVTGLIAGFHNLYTRFRDGNGIWSLTEARGFYIDAGGLNSIQKISKGEYFFDTDPGTGKGKAISVPSAADSLTGSISIPVTQTGGFHQLFIRYADLNGKWGHAEGRVFYVDTASGKVTGPLVAGEYFIGPDPGFGKGRAISFLAADSIDIDQIIQADASLPIGTYSLNIRVKDAGGIWSLVESRTIKVCTSYGADADFEIVRDNNKVSFVNNSQHSILYQWSFGDNDTSRLEKPYHEYRPGNYNITLIASNPCGADTMQQALTIEGIDNITPATGGNTGVVTVRVKGFGFVTGTTLKISNANAGTLAIAKYSIQSNELLLATMDLTGAVAATYDVEVSIPGRPTLKINNGFRVMAGVNPIVKISTSMPLVIRSGRPTLISVFVRNEGNINANGVPVLISGLPYNSQVKLLTDTLQTPIRNEADTVYQVPDFVIKDSIALDLKIPVLIPELAPSETFEIKLEVIATSNFSPDIQVFEPLFSSGILAAKPAGPATNNCDHCYTQYWTDVAVELGKAVIKVAAKDWGDCISGAVGLGYNLYKMSSSASRGEKPGGLLSWFSLSGGSYKTAVSCATAITGTVLPIGFWGRLALSAYEGYTQYKKLALYSGLSTAECYLKCIDSKQKQKETVEVRTSWDPNAKIGPGGASDGFINADKTLGYTIFFENQPAATLPAQTVVIYDTLDTSILDMSTFAFTGVSVGLKPVSINDSKYSFVRDVDLRPVVNFKARVLASVDTLTGILRAEYQSIDPITNQVTDNAIEGFLLPNNNKHDGEGSISYQVQRKNTVTEGMVLKNRAKIVFDFNPPIFTEYWINKFDFTKPVSKVSALPSITGSDTIVVKWTGTDAASGILSYDVYISINDSAFVPWILNSTNSKDTLIGEFGVKYSFFAVATDRAGNAETVKTGSEATTVVYYTNVPQIKILSSPVMSGKDTLKVGYTFFNALSPDNKFILEMTNATGSVNSFAPIKTIADSSRTGIINAIIDSNISCGNEYRIRLISTNPKDTSAVAGFLEIYNNPVSRIQPAGNDTACAGGVINLTGEIVQGASYQWLKDGLIINGATQSAYVANATGRYQVLVSKGSCDSLSLPRNLVFINQPLPPTVTAGVLVPSCAGGSITLSSNAPTGNQWYKDGVAIRDSTRRFFVATSSGNYTSRVSNGYCESLQSNTIAVTINNVLVAPVITASAAIEFCQGENVLLNSTAASGNQWYKDGVAITGSTAATYTASTTGSYSVKATVNGCESPSSNAIVVTVHSIPTTPVVTAGAATTFCTGGSVTLTSNAATGNQWFKDGIAIINSTGKTYVALTSGNYTVKVKVSGCESNPSNTIIVSVNSTPPLPTITANAATTFCQGGSVKLISNAASGNQWYRDGIAIGGATGAAYDATATGNYTIKVTAGGCESPVSAAIVVTVNQVPTPPAISAGTTTTFCEGGSVTLTSNVSVGNQWYKDGTAITGSTNNTYNVLTSGNYSAKIVVSGCESAASNVVNVTVNATPPTPTIAGNANQLVSSAPNGNQWYRDGTVIAGATGQSYTPTVSGNYTVQVTVNNCASPISLSFAYIYTAVPDIDAFGNQVKIMPNPVEDKLIILRNNPALILNIQLYDMHGRQLKVMTSSLSRTEIDMTRYPAGLYIVRIQDKKNKISGKKVIVKLK